MTAILAQGGAAQAAYEVFAFLLLAAFVALIASWAIGHLFDIRRGVMNRRALRSIPPGPRHEQLEHVACQWTPNCWNVATMYRRTPAGYAVPICPGCNTRENMRAG